MSEDGGMSEPTEWCWDCLPSNAAGSYAVVRCYDAAEGMFPDSVVAPASWPADMAIIAHAGPFPTEADALRWAEAHDPEF